MRPMLQMQTSLGNLGINEKKLPGLVLNPDEALDSNHEKVELFLSCRKLKNMDVFSLTDPKIRVYAVHNDTEWPLGETEMIQDNLNPDFTKTFVIDYKFETKQSLHFEIIDVDAFDKWELVGHVYTTLGHIVGSKNQAAVFDIKDKEKVHGKLIVRSEKVNGTQSTATFEICARKLRNKHGWFKTSSPYFKLTRMTGDSEKVVVYESNVVKSDLNPQWKPFGILMQKLCNGDILRPINLEVYTRKIFKEKLIGECTFTVDELLNQEKREFVLNRVDKKQKPGIIEIKEFGLGSKPTFLDYLRGGVQLNVAVAIDFTASNGLSTNPASLHALHPNGQLNQYQKAIQGVCEILLCYDYDKKVPVYGFGGIPSGVASDATSHCFALSGHENNPYVFGIEGITDIYKHALGKVLLNGPTHFSEILRKIMGIAKSNKAAGSKEYTILLILTDGLIHDMQATINCLIESACLPLSVIIVGVGNADFHNMNVLDGDEGLQNEKGVQAPRDLVQFVPFNKFKGNKEELAKEVLEEVPVQFMEYMEAVRIAPGNKEEINFNELVWSKPHLPSGGIQSKPTLGQPGTAGKPKPHSEIEDRKRANTQEDAKKQGQKRLSII